MERRASGMHYSPAAVWPVATAGRIFIAAPDRVLSAIDASTGRTLWRTAESTVRETVGLSGRFVESVQQNDAGQRRMLFHTRRPF